MDVVDNPNDFHTYFRGTYIGLPKKNRIEPCVVERVDHVEADEWRCRLIHQNEQGEQRPGVWKPFKDVVEEYVLIPPELGAISTNISLVYVSLRPLRQFRKGLESRRLSISPFHDRGTLPTQRTELKYLVEYIFNPIKFGFLELWDLLGEGKRVGGAIDNRFGLVLKPNINCPLLTYKDEVIGACLEKQHIKLFPGYAKYVDHITRNIAPKVELWN